jgi:hypothetical protein
MMMMMMMMMMMIQMFANFRCNVNDEHQPSAASVRTTHLSSSPPFAGLPHLAALPAASALQPVHDAPWCAGRKDTHCDLI